ncbi:glycoside hydrolase [Exidia glandulosa HHB12029]|uniref:cellulase n=1 Tax=Exidia glandulosa HHB12029 TaxID=1314781 RepID=A0A165FKM1_EXIGL|nr:glycoside hydrolase [Exidia glandulosa HHB12029]KZV89148.1 glycoside hydrolase [Exidia glandulosa HHB12029]
MLSKTTATLALYFAGALSKILYAGVNESGGEFGVFSDNSTLGFGLPGRFGSDFAFINKSTVDIFVRDDKINLFRVAFLMERMCPVNLKTGKGLGRRFNETYFAEYKDAIDYITLHHEKFALLDPHNYMRYNDPSQQPFSGSVIGNTTDPRAATTQEFEEFWFELASRFRNNPRVIFGINNEPNSMPTSLVLKNDQAAVNGIRAAGAAQLILAPGNGFTGGHSWTQVSQGDDPSSDFMAKLFDPLHNLAIEVHEYLDVDFSGSHAECEQPGPSNLANLTTWLKQNNLKALVGEFGAGNNDNCRDFVGDLLDYIEANDEYIGWAAWAAGPLWGTFRSCCGDDTGNLEPGTVTDLGTPGAYESVWIPAVRPRIPKVLKTHGISSLHM